MRRPMVATIGTASIEDAGLLKMSEELGRMLIDNGYRIVNGGMTGVMEAVCRGAHSSEKYREGDCMGIVMRYDPDVANPYMDIVIPTGMGFARNVMVVASGDVVVALGGGAGTLSEIAMAWSLGKDIIALKAKGWSGKLGGMSLDERRDDRIISAESPQEVLEHINRLLYGKQ